MLAWDSDNEPVLPTLKTVLKLKGDVRISNELTRELNGLDDYLDVVRVAPFLSDPTVIDTYEDELSDDKDANPLHAFNSDFILTDNIDEIPSNYNIDTKELEAQKIYNSYSTKEKISKFLKLKSIDARAHLNVIGGSLANYRIAALFMDHFLSNSGEDYYYDASPVIIETDCGYSKYLENLNTIIKLCEETVIDELSFSSNYYAKFPGANFVQSGYYEGDYISRNWYYSIGDADAVMSFTCKKKNNEYTLSINYYLLDYYDWKKDSPLKGGFVTDGEMDELHRAGMAKEFKSIGMYSQVITWNEGEKIDRI